jgi:hypothetical protein
MPQLIAHIDAIARDGRMRVPGVRFMMMSLELANRNAQHDEPGYLENLWAQERLQ